MTPERIRAVQEYALAHPLVRAMGISRENVVTFDGDSRMQVILTVNK